MKFFFSSQLSEGRRGSLRLLINNSIWIIAIEKIKLFFLIDKTWLIKENKNITIHFRFIVSEYIVSLDIILKVSAGVNIGIKDKL